MPRVIRSAEALVSTTRLAGGSAQFAAYLTRQDFRSGLRGFGVRSLDPGAALEAADVGGVEEVLFVIAGVGTVAGSAGEAQIQPGDVVLTRSGERRGIRNIGAEPLVFATFAADVPAGA